MFEILDHFNPKWADLVKEYDLDVYFTPQYCKIWEELGDGKAEAFFYESSLGKALYPYLVRNIDVIGFRDYFDISTPYGYGGPVLLEYNNQNLPLLIKDFRFSFAQYAYKRGVINEFIRFHPVSKNYHFFLNSDINCKFIRNTIVMDLVIKPEEILMNMSAKTRNEVRQSIRNGLNIVFKSNPLPEDIKTFRTIYIKTMNRLKASEYYKFPLDFFFSTFNLLKGNAELVFVYKDDVLISSAIFLLSNEIAHYHLSGSLPQYLSLRPNNALLYQAALRYKLMGIKHLHLGGGYTGNDSLFKFKRGFSKNGLLNFFIGTKIFDNKVYNILVSEWKKKRSLGVDFQSDFFPLYRLQI